MSGEGVVIGRSGGVDLVRFDGEIDLASARPIYERVVDETLDARQVILDLSSVSFLDSAGVRLLDDLVHTYGLRSIPIRLVAPEPGPARFTLMLCGFRTDLLCGNVGEALESI